VSERSNSRRCLVRDELRIAVRGPLPPALVNLLSKFTYYSLWN